MSCCFVVLIVASGCLVCIVVNRLVGGRGV